MSRDKTPHPLLKATSPLPWLLVIPLVLLVLPEGGRGTLQLEYDELMNGQLYRLWTAHLVHMSSFHAVLNCGALLAICLICQPATLLRLNWGFVLAVPPAISAALLFAPPGFDWYLGLSGLLHGLALFLGAAGLTRGDRAAGVLAAGVLAKILFEGLTWTPAAWETLLGGPVLTVAHAWGALAAGLWFIACRGFVAHQHRV